MKRLLILVVLLAVAFPALAKTHREIYNVPCSQLWVAVKDTLRNSGQYGIIAVDNIEMTASYNIGGFLGGKRINSVILTPQGESARCRCRPPSAALPTTMLAISKSASPNRLRS